MISYMIPLVQSWLPIWNEYLVYFFALGFLAWVPSAIIAFFRR